MQEEQYIYIDKLSIKRYYKNKEMTICHRLDGPAVEWIDGSKAWYQNGHLHRLDGPAVDWNDGYKGWYIEGVQYSEEEFKAKMQPKVNINGKDFTVGELNRLIETAKGK